MHEYRTPGCEPRDMHTTMTDKKHEKKHLKKRDEEAEIYKIYKL